MARISIIIPCYYNEENIPHTSKELIENESRFPPGTTFEYVMVDDGSRDGTFGMLKLFHEKFSDKVKVIRLAGNVGSYNAILAGMEYATGDCCTVISADLQDPPELIPEMFGHWQEGIKLVVANREQRHDPILTAMFARLYHGMLRRFALKNIPKGGYDFVLFDRKLKDQVLQIREKNTNTLYMLAWLGYPYKSIPYTRQKRKHGKSRWTISKKIKLFVDSFVSFSYLPLRMISLLGLILGSIALFYAIYIIVRKMFGEIDVQGWSAMMVVLLFVSSFQMIAIGIIGEYVWRSLDASRNRPIYIVEEVLSKHYDP